MKDGYEHLFKKIQNKRVFISTLGNMIGDTSAVLPFRLLEIIKCKIGGKDVLLLTDMGRDEEDRIDITIQESDILELEIGNEIDENLELHIKLKSGKDLLIAD